MRKTTNYGLALYDKEDKMNITSEENSLNHNMELIDSALKGKANDSDIPTKLSELENDKNYLSSIPAEYVTDSKLLEKSFATETYVKNEIANAQLGGDSGEVDLSGYATKDDLNNKVDKVSGKSLVDDEEITRLKNVTNYDDTELKNQINSKASISDMTNYIEEHKDELKGADGKDGTNGTDGKDGVSVTHSWNGTTLNVTSASGTSSMDLKGAKGEKGDKGDTGAKGDKGDTGSKGEDGYTPVKGTDYWTEEDKEEMITSISDVCIVKNQGSGNVGKILVVGTDGNLMLANMPEGGSSGDVTGMLDDSNNILLSGNLANGTYTLKWLKDDGTYADAGTLIVTSIIEYTITTTLTNCSATGATKINANGSATVIITASEGYTLPDNIEVSGASYTWDKSTGNIILSNPISDVYITVTAEKSITNFAEPNSTNKTDWSIWCNDARIGSDGAYRSSTTQHTTNYISVQKGDEVHWKNMIINGQIIGFYGASKNNVKAGNSGDAVTAGTITDCSTLTASTRDGYFTINSDAVSFVKFTILHSGYTWYSNDNVVINIKRNGEWL